MNPLQSSTIPRIDRDEAISHFDTPEHRGKSVDEISREIGLDRLRDGTLENADSVNLPIAMDKAFAKEKKAMTALEEAKAARASAESLILEWEQQIEDLNRLRKSAEILRAAVQGAKDDIAETRVRLARHVRECSLREIAFAADHLALRETALPILKATETAHAAALKAHIAGMLKWGAANGVPAEVLSELQTAPAQD